MVDFGVLKQNSRQEKFGNGGERDRSDALLQVSRELVGRRPEGLYAYGGPGSGKSMFLEMLFDLIDTKFKMKMQGTEFMSKVHQRMYMLSQVRILIVTFSFLYLLFSCVF